MVTEQSTINSNSAMEIHVRISVFRVEMALKTRMGIFLTSMQSILSRLRFVSRKVSRWEQHCTVSFHLFSPQPSVYFFISFDDAAVILVRLLKTKVAAGMQRFKAVSNHHPNS
jgi:hypothetical protein